MISFTCLSFCLSFCQSVSLYIYLFQSINLYLYLSVYAVSQPFCLFLYLLPNSTISVSSHCKKKYKYCTKRKHEDMKLELYVKCKCRLNFCLAF